MAKQCLANECWSCVSADDYLQQIRLTLPAQQLGRYQVQVVTSLSGACDITAFPQIQR